MNRRHPDSKVAIRGFLEAGVPRTYSIAMVPWALPVRFLLNGRADPPLPYGAEQRAVVNLQAHEEAFQVISSWEGYGPTPLVELPGLAEALGLGRVLYKDEGHRLGLGSFKALGGMYGVMRVLESGLREAMRNPGLSYRDFRREPQASWIATQTVACASAGNHGRAVARGAAMFGCGSVVFLPVHTSRHRVEAIQALGADVNLVEGSFDDAVVEAAARADEEGWYVVADTTFPGYRQVPRTIMQGYTVLAREFLDQMGEAIPSHVFLQAGVGGLAAAVTGHLWESLGPRRPRIVVVEPAEADCLLESRMTGQASASRGSIQTTMECLACREASDLAWAILGPGADAFVTVADSATSETVDFLAEGIGGDPPLLTQPSGAAGVSGLFAAHFEPALAGPLGLGPDSTVLVIGSEGPSERGRG